MKTIFMSLLLLVGMMGYSQRGPQHHAYKDMSPEQIAQLETKKLTLALDLSEKQQQQIGEIYLDKAIEMKAKMEEKRSRDSKPDADERYAMMNERLDRQLEMKENMRQILDKDQFEKWEKLAVKREIRGRCKVHKGR